jgi:hypothetical protein
MREAIFGDLHEEFVRDVAQLGVESARSRYRKRVLEIVAHAVWDTFRWRTWASTQASDLMFGQRGRQQHELEETRVRETARERRRIGQAIGFTLLGFVVLVIGIVVNTSVFAIVGEPATTLNGSHAGVQADGLRASVLPVVLGIASILLMVASATVAALVICIGPRWRRRRIAPVSGAATITPERPDASTAVGTS